MPKLQQVYSEDQMRTARAKVVMDLAPYLEIIDSIKSQQGVGGEVSLDDDESQRTEKRRLSLAAKERKYRLTWMKAGERRLRFVLASEGQPTPGGRRRRATETPTDEQPAETPPSEEPTVPVVSGGSDAEPTTRKRGKR